MLLQELDSGLDLKELDEIFDNAIEETIKEGKALLAIKEQKFDTFNGTEEEREKIISEMKAIVEENKEEIVYKL